MATSSRASYRPPSPVELAQKSRPARSGVVPKPARRAPEVRIPRPPAVPKPIAAIPLQKRARMKPVPVPPPTKPSVVVLGCIWLLG